MRKAVVIVPRSEQRFILYGHLSNIRNPVLLVVQTLVVLPIEIYLVPAFLSKRDIIKKLFPVLVLVKAVLSKDTENKISKH